ncbi:MAG: hypothetical protein U1E65_16755 [Myxococcota bacterium]
MSRLEGPLREHVEDPTSDAQVARLEQVIGARRLGRVPQRRSRLWIPALAAAFGLTLALVGSRSPPAPSVGPSTPAVAQDTAPAPVPASVTAPEPALDTEPEALAPSALTLREGAPKSMPSGRPAPTAPVQDQARIQGTAGRAALPAPELAAIDALWEEIDRARAQGENERAVERLGQLIETYPSDARAGLAAFVRARILQDLLGRAEQAAVSIDVALRLGVPADLEEAARARRFQAYASARLAERAQQAARDYLLHYPEGAHRDGARALAGDGAR